MKKTEEKVIINSGTAVTNATVSTDTNVATSTVVTNAVISPAPSQKEVNTTKSKKNSAKEKKTSKATKDKSTKDKPKLVVKKKTSEEKKAEKPKVDDKPKESVRDKMFPANITVHGVKFKRLEDTDIEKAKVKNMNQLIIHLSNNEGIVMFGYYTPEEITMPKANRKTCDYERNTGIKPPAKFPYEVEMCLIDAILPINAKEYISHSIYTEYAGATPFSALDKRGKEQYFVSPLKYGKVPFEVYIADYENADNKVEESFINLYDDSVKEEDK